MTTRSKAEICDFAQKFKAIGAAFGFVTEKGALDLKSCYEYLQYLWQDWHFIVLEKEEMGQLLGETRPASKTIVLRNDVYTGMCRGEPEHCFTAAHELGHMMLHSELAFARRETAHNPLEIISIEQEADTFAESLLGFDSPANVRMREVVKLLIEGLQNSSKKKPTK